MNSNGTFITVNRKWGAFIFVTMLLLTTAACKPATIKDVYTPKEWRDMLKEAGDWVPLPYPESAFRPGSIIMVTDTSTRWIDHLESCKYPADILAPEKSHIPNISFNKGIEFGANAVIGYRGIEAAPGFSKVSKVNFEVLDHGVEYLRIVRFNDWNNDPKNKKKVSASCMKELAKKDRYLITEAFRVNKAAYTLIDQSGVAIKLSLPLLKDLLKISGDLKCNIDSNGKLVIEQPAYFAVRKAIRVGGDFEPRGEEKDADKKIESAFFKNVPGGGQTK